jgi:hypothetical protein
MHWIGSKEANPSEAPLEMPQELQTPILRKSATGASHAGHRFYTLHPVQPTVLIVPCPLLLARRGSGKWRAAACAPSALSSFAARVPASHAACVPASHAARVAASVAAQPRGWCAAVSSEAAAGSCDA